MASIVNGQTGPVVVITPGALLEAQLAANVPAVTTGGLVLLSDVITALGTLQASHNSLLANLKAAGIMVPD